LAGDAVDGPEAIAMSIVAQPDVAVLDDELDVISGREVAVQLRVYAPESRIILLLSPSDRLFTSRPSVIDAIYPRDGDRRALVDLIARLAA
jgi:CheY-like chemotaxis protein